MSWDPTGIGVHYGRADGAYALRAFPRERALPRHPTSSCLSACSSAASTSSARSNTPRLPEWSAFSRTACTAWRVAGRRNAEEQSRWQCEMQPQANRPTGSAAAALQLGAGWLAAVDEIAPQPRPPSLTAPLSLSLPTPPPTRASDSPTGLPGVARGRAACAHPRGEHRAQRRFCAALFPVANVLSRADLAVAHGGGLPRSFHRALLLARAARGPATICERERSGRISDHHRNTRCRGAEATGTGHNVEARRATGHICSRSSSTRRQAWSASAWGRVATAQVTLDIAGSGL